MNPPTTQPASPYTNLLAMTEAALAILAILAVYLLLQENGTLLPSHTAEYLHELTHDARHALGMPCH